MLISFSGTWVCMIHTGSKMHVGWAGTDDDYARENVFSKQMPPHFKHYMSS
jgi:hypothetical protein